MQRYKRRKLVNKCISRITKRNVFIVAEINGTFIQYNQKDYEKVIECLGFATPRVIAKYISEKDALKYLQTKSQEIIDDLECNNFNYYYNDDDYEY